MNRLQPTYADLGDDGSGSRSGTGSWRWRALRRFFRQPASFFGLLLLGILVFTAVFAKQITPYDPSAILIGVEDVEKRAPPCIHLLGCPESEPQHIMGTDGNIRDFFSRIIYGSRTALFIGIVTVGSAVLVGMLLGTAAGYHGGWLDIGIMRAMDVLLAFPAMLLVLVIVAAIGPGYRNIAIAIAIVQVPHYARIIRARVVSLKETAFIESSRALGGGYFHILFHRILPNASSPLIVRATLGVAAAILDAAAMSFLGLNAAAEVPDWGAMIGSELNQVFTSPHMVIFPGLAIMFTVLAFNLLGDGLRETFDPRQARFDIRAQTGKLPGSGD
jgi:ABC-type dipeptide/oligopeptide/nickel transport system permease subunit